MRYIILATIVSRLWGEEETGAKFWSTLDPGQQAFTYQAGGVLRTDVDSPPSSTPRY